MSGVIGDLEQLECLYTEELEYPRHKGELGYPGQTSPTTDQLVQPRTRIYSPAGSRNKATGDLE